MDIITLCKTNTEKFVHLLNEFDEELFFRSPENGGWSAADIAEHIYRSEFALSKLFNGKTEPSDQPISDNELKKMDAIFMNRDKKAEAPNVVKPSGHSFSRTELIDLFKSNREKVIDQYSNMDPDARCLMFKHPMFGILSRKEWLYASVMHTERHMLQLQELKSSLN